MATREIEAKLARRPDIYLVVRAPERRLEIKARGIVVDTVPLLGVELVSPHHPLHRPRPHALEVPILLTVVDGPGESAREVIAPPELRPMPNEDEEESEGDEGTSRPSATPTPIPEPPTSYRAELDNGWDLWICEELPADGVLGRFRAAIADGWRRLWGHTTNARPALTLAVGREDAQRLFHLINDERQVLVAAGRS